MKVVFISNYFNHHQRPLSDALYEITEGNYHFIETAPMREERRQMGYGWDDLPAYVRTAYRSEAEKQLCCRLVTEADVVIAGSAPEEFLKERIKAGKLIFRYAERPLKHGLEPLKYLPRLIRWHRRNPAGKPIYLLCASAYAAADYAKFGLFRDRAYRWGYFPEAKRYPQLPAKEENSILWVGRFLDWKHPDDALEAAARLHEAGCRFKMIFIGTGPMEQQLREEIASRSLENCVCLLGSMKPEQVRTYMERASILLFTSDRQEGWGAVVNEAMNSGCAVIASDAAGSVPYLIRDRENGMIYPSGNVDRLTGALKRLLDSPETCRTLGTEAYRTMIDTWNADSAARRLLALAEGLLGMNPVPHFEDGPCSRT